ncbi:S1 family peptidase [Streptomyces sp. DT24]|uniref:S1 family peptidase n=1 Tax=unclassified Streptomyces TaxID=2593676 RepID=UPI0023B92F19|nr:S1 family peptidase [Streptomyces sp. AM 4-1-1]WEH35173.1 S1 family peptidase [Streptomyces sp. AM 4-1-1]
MRVSRKYVIAATVGALLSVSAVTGAQAVTQAPVHPQYQPEMIKALAASLGVSEQAATARLEQQDAQQARLASLGKHGIKTNGAFFDQKGTLTVNATDAGTAAKIKAEGLNSQVPTHGQAALDRIKARLDAAALKQAPTGVSAWSVDLASDTVTVEVNDAGTPAARAFIKEAKANGSAVRVVNGKQTLSPMGVIYPGSQMTFNKDGGSYLCSVGYGAHDASGKQYLVTAGHCVENLPVLSYNGARFAKATSTRFAVGSRSVDMGVATIDSGNSIATAVGTWGNGGNVAVKGSKRASSGAALCKSGQTTGWTCGKVNSYNVSVTYTDAHGGPDTVVTGLGSSSVCTEGGDSGGAYISGNQGQGMTSGGPTNQQCTGGVNSRGSSYFQPLDDALSYYRLTLNTN